ncbi:MAG: MBL fold metallo-hydrolase [Alphaproteobacteria bacterium]|nr:MBL fold metallo-hydrolase [Alphaproteobacteria bacterium]MBM3951565.1 MBL fold metallo-hydrolase [Rhodospirillales bacterium]
MTNEIDRRGFLQGTAATVGVAFAGTVLHDSRAHAQAARIAVPTVDRLSIRVVSDSSHDIFISGESPKDVKVERVRGLPPPRAKRTLHNDWGLSLLLESTKDGDQRTHMLDFGGSPEVLNHNVDMLDLDPSKIGGLIVSHGHYDHFGGLVGFLQKHRARMPADLTLYTGGEDNFCMRHTRTPKPGVFNEWGALDRREVAAQKVKLALAENPAVIGGHVFTTGAIPRRSVEKVLPNTMVELAVRADGLGCNASHFAPAELQGKIVADEHYHEHATCFNVKNRGLVVISSCGHAGVVNSILRAREVSGIDKVHALVGGFHLAPAPKPYLDQVMAELKKLDVDYMIPMHCSGTNFINAVAAQMPEKLILSSTGSRFTFGA